MCLLVGWSVVTPYQGVPGGVVRSRTHTGRGFQAFQGVECTGRTTPPLTPWYGLEPIRGAGFRKTYQAYQAKVEKRRVMIGALHHHHSGGMCCSNTHSLFLVKGVVRLVQLGSTPLLAVVSANVPGGTFCRGGVVRLVRSAAYAAMADTQVHKILDLVRRAKAL